MGPEVKVANILNDFMRTEAIEEGLSCFLVQRPETDRMSTLQSDLSAILSGLPVAEQGPCVKQYIRIASSMTNSNRLQLLLKVLHDLVQKNVLEAKMVCECILQCESLTYKNGAFWIECFNLIRKIIGRVYYKGVRDIMKVCREKVQTLPVRLTASVMPQMKAVESVLEHLFDRNACLLPAYLLINELKPPQCPHWKLAPLVSNFIESFRPTAQMVSIIGHGKLLPVVLYIGVSEQYALPWRLDPHTLMIPQKATLPYDPHLLEPQTALLRHVLNQPYCKDMVCHMLGLAGKTKTHCLPLERAIVDCIIVAMEKAENESFAEEHSPSVWLHLSSLIIHFTVKQFVIFNNLCQSLHDKLTIRTDLRKGRDHLMFVCLQFITGSIHKTPLSQFLGVLKVYDLLYPEKDPLPVPDISNPMCTHQMAACCIWITFFKKAQDEPNDILRLKSEIQKQKAQGQDGKDLMAQVFKITTLHRLIPPALQGHFDFIQRLLPSGNGGDYRTAILCNAYSTQTQSEHFSRSLVPLLESIKQSNLSNPSHSSPPLPMAMLDAMTVHCKMTIMQFIGSHIVKAAAIQKHAQANMPPAPPVPLSPALVETYSRLLVYTEIESLGVKQLHDVILSSVFHKESWGILYTLFEMFSYRMHHIQSHYRVQLLSRLRNMATGSKTNQTQLHLCMESTALRLITNLESSEVQSELARFSGDYKSLVSAESEELNRALVLTLARSMHIMGTGQELKSQSKDNIDWCTDFLTTIMEKTPHTWAKHTLEFFPPFLKDFFVQSKVTKEDPIHLKKAVEEEYRNWASMNNENDIFVHFTDDKSPSLFLCLLWKVILETERVNPIAYKILERIGPRALSTHLRKFCEYLVNELSSKTTKDNNSSMHVSKCVDAVNLMIWKYNILTIDRLVLCLSMRPHEGEMCFFIIQVLLLKTPEFRTRVQEFVRDLSPDHWNQSNWHEKHVAFHRKFPENLAPESTSLEQSGGTSNSYSLPVYFGNVCLRFLPVFDNLIHRYIEMPSVLKSLECLLEHLGCLYKFHNRPVTYLYDTLHYYESKVRDRASLKRRLVLAVLGSLQELKESKEKKEKSSGYGLSLQYQQYMQGVSDWTPDLDYYMWLVQRICDTMSGKIQFHTDWRFNEFPNPSSHVLYVTCVELMSLPLSPVDVGNKLLDVVMKGYTVIPFQQIMSWINAIGLIMAALPNSYWQALHERLVSIINCPQMLQWPYRNSPFQMFNFQDTHESMLENKFSYALALAHSAWHHAGTVQILLLPEFVKKDLKPIIRTEEQLLFLCHLIGPFFQRFGSYTHQLTEFTVVLYETIELVDQNVPYLHHMDTICDLLYHIKYMAVGDAIKRELLEIIKRLRPSLQMRLRFIVQLSLSDIKGC